MLEDIYDEAVEVHHKDENPLNCALDNLEVLCKKEHSKLHNPSLRYCLECEKTKLSIYNTSGICRNCQTEILEKEFSLEQIVERVLKSNWTQAAKYFGMSDNGLRKRYKKLSGGKDPKTIRNVYSC